MLSQGTSSTSPSVGTRRGAGFGWLDILRIGLVQAALGAIVVLTTSTMNRIMVVELAIPAAVPGALVALHYVIQTLRPRLGHGSDVSGRRTPWIIGGMIVLALGAVLASIGIAVAAASMAGAMIISVLGFVLIGLGVGASGTALLTLLAKGTVETRRAPAATIVWVMMIVGFILTTAVVGQLLDPWSPGRLIELTAAVGASSVVVTLLATWGLERRAGLPSVRRVAPAGESAGSGFRTALREVWAEPLARRFGFFVFVSMLAYSAQDLILEPFAGSVFGMTPGQSTALSSVQHGGVLVGMVLVAVLGARGATRRFGSLWAWAWFGCIASAIALLGLMVGALVGQSWPLQANVFALGLANGAYAVAAIGSMMNLVDKGNKAREGLRMGMWGAAQALAFGLGGFLGAFASDIARWWFDSPALGYGLVFVTEAVLFIVASVMARRLAGQFASEAQRLGERPHAAPQSVPIRPALSLQSEGV